MILILIIIAIIILLLPVVCFKKCPLPEQNVDVLIVLGCPAYPDGSMSETQKMRVEKAAEAIQTYQIQWCILTGGKAHNEYSEAHVMANYLRTLTDVNLILEDKSTTTYENMKNCALFCQQHSFRKIGILTSGYHANRAYAMSRKFFRDIVIFKAPYRFTLKKIVREYISRGQYLFIEMKHHIKA